MIFPKASVVSHCFPDHRNSVGRFCFPTVCGGWPRDFGVVDICLGYTAVNRSDLRTLLPCLSSSPFMFYLTTSFQVHFIFFKMYFCFMYVKGRGGCGKTEGDKGVAWGWCRKRMVHLLAHPSEFLQQLRQVQAKSRILFGLKVRRLTTQEHVSLMFRHLAL